MLQTGMNRHHHGHWLHFGKKPKPTYLENSFSPWNRSKVGSIARSSLGGERCLLCRLSRGHTLSAVGMSELQVLLQCKSQPLLGSGASPPVLRAQPGNAQSRALLDPALWPQPHTMGGTVAFWNPEKLSFFLFFFFFFKHLSPTANGIS